MVPGLMLSFLNYLLQNIPIDVCKIWGEDAVFLQQAAHITEGIYMRPSDPAGLLQVLMVSLS